MAVLPKQETHEIAIPPVTEAKLQKHLPESKEQAKLAENDRKGAIDALTKIRRASAWQIHRWPLEKRIVEEKTRIHLPRSYLATDGEEERVVWPGEDLNQVVYEYYLESVNLKDGSDKVNFVARDGVTPRRHEYLGPDPRVAGYFFDFDGEIHIRWWDAFLQDQWMDKHKWKMDVELDQSGEWVMKEH
ncbi:hypothetical protein NEOLEDRAFT_1158436 [Neolentinus lepideus HHB14362 ss-1]|uniref:Uncharacterized protein n=1 Tax=Neolentinus lepideus HHB14362 ss-1 TaxID=1314782 RepID=A0A165PCH1_9AGAM|nr:hypothetical protein NEOLEDRAFT_1158436 [Neolentinus lepideus HHB14362 ss-1]